MMTSLRQGEFAIRHAYILARSFQHFTSRNLLAGEFSAETLAEALFAAPFVLVSHGTQADPVLNYGNRMALDLWEMTAEEFTRTPSRLTAEAPNREERARLLAAVTAHGFIDNYSGVRISRTGRRFEISRATVWNLLTPDGVYYGQAAMFFEWKFLLVAARVSLCLVNLSGNKFMGCFPLAQGRSGRIHLLRALACHL